MPDFATWFWACAAGLVVVGGIPVLVRRDRRAVAAFVAALVWAAGVALVPFALRISLSTFERVMTVLLVASNLEAGGVMLLVLRALLRDHLDVPREDALDAEGRLDE